MSDLAWLSLMAVLFVGQHLGVTSSGLRDCLVARLGEKAYIGVYSLVSIVLFVLLVRAYNDMVPTTVFWPTYEWLRFVPVVLMPLALFLLLSGVLLKNPTIVGVVLDEGEDVPVAGVMRITRHPVQCAILLWAMSHLIANGDPGSLVFFGSIAVVSGYGMLLIDRRKRTVFGEHWEGFRAATSVVPFVAIVQGRQSLRLSEFGWLVPLLTIATFALLWWGHVWVSGVNVGV